MAFAPAIVPAKCSPNPVQGRYFKPIPKPQTVLTLVQHHMPALFWKLSLCARLTVSPTLVRKESRSAFGRGSLFCQIWGEMPHHTKLQHSTRRPAHTSSAAPDPPDCSRGAQPVPGQRLGMQGFLMDLMLFVCLSV